MEGQPPPPTPQVELITITTKITDSFEENCEVEDDIKEEIVEEIFVEVDDKERSCLDAIYVDFSKYFSSKEPHVSCSKESLRMSFFSSGGCLNFDVRHYLHLFSVKTKIKKISKIIKQDNCIHIII
jgi:hypothetical protein